MCPDFNKKSAWGKAMRRKITMDHNLGTSDYIGNKKVWALQDAAEDKAGRPAPYRTSTTGVQKIL
jgi:hypothetical protein